MRKAIATLKAPAAVGPYSQAVAIGNTLYTAGQIPLDPATGEVVAGDISAQTQRALENLAAILEANHMTFANVVKTTVFMTNLGDFSKMNAVYQSFFKEPYPARSTVQVVALPKNVEVEIEAIAIA